MVMDTINACPITNLTGSEPRNLNKLNLSTGKLVNRGKLEKKVNNSADKIKIDSNKLSVLYGNVQSLRNKFSYIGNKIINNTYDVVAFTETWLSCHERDFIAEFKIKGYKTINKDRTDKRGGGVILYIKDHLKFREIDGIDTIENIDCIYIELKNSANKKLRIGIYYRPPGQKAEIDSKIIDQIFNMSSNCNDIIILGDFNLPCRKWGEPYNLYTGKNLYEYLVESELIQLVREPTRYNNILDLVLTTNEEIINNINIDEKLGDHNAVEFDIQFENENKISEQRSLNFNKANYDKMRESFSQMLPIQNMENLSCNEAWTVLYTTIKSLESKYVETRNFSNFRHKYNWISKDIKQAFNCKRRLYKQYKQNLNGEVLAKYSKQRKKLNKTNCGAKEKI
jgi:hypothetical protein